MSENESNTIPYSILVVVHDDTSRIDMVKTLEGKGFEVFGEKSGHRAEATATSLKSELFIIDMELPRLYGFHLIRKFRKAEEFQNNPIILVTPKLDKRQLSQMQDFDIKDILIQPVEEEKLIKSVEKYYRMKVIREVSKDD